MKVSGFTFLRNGQKLGYPFVESIRSVLPIVDEFVVALGPCEDDTEARLRAIGDPRLRIIHTTWNEGIRPAPGYKGFVYAQQKSIALFNCTGDWAFYLEGDEVVHEQDLERIRGSMERHLDNPKVEALAFDYLHFYGNGNTLAWSPAWYRREVRILRNSIPAWAPEGLFFAVLDRPLRARYPRAALTGATIHHYGWVRPEARMQALKGRIEKYWSDRTPAVDYSAIDPQALRPFTGSHPAAIRDWLGTESGLFAADPNHRLTSRERKHRIMMAIERRLGLYLGPRGHFRLVS